MQTGSVRGPRGVQMDEVWSAADAVLALGERPTIERVRQQLGRGSPNTVGPMLDGWYGSLAKRLRTPAEAADQAADAGPALPPAVVRAAKTLWGRAVQQAEEQVAVQFVQDRGELKKQAEALDQIREELGREKQRLDDRSEAYAVAMQAREAQIDELARQVHEVQQQLRSTQQRLESALAESGQLRQAADVERRRMELKEAEHQTERSRLEERSQLQERRLHAEVDRARQESKRLALQAEADGKKSSKALTDAVDRARELEEKIAVLQLQKADVARELELAREETKALLAKTDERSTELFAVLNELRDRLAQGRTEEPPPINARKRRNKG